jgi:hypothetical protein
MNDGTSPIPAQRADEPVERWLPVVGYEGLYEVSDLGRVKSLRRLSSQGGYTIGGRMLSIAPGRYLTVCLYRNGVKATKQLHVLIAAAFIGPRPTPKHVVRHLNGDPGDTVLSNLAYGTTSDNQLDAVRHGTHGNTRKTHCPRGHAYTPENTYLHGMGYRACRACEPIWREMAKARAKLARSRTRDAVKS